MDFSYAPEDEAFREELESWLDDNLPKFLTEWGEQDLGESDPADAELSEDENQAGPGSAGIMGRYGKAARLAETAEHWALGCDQLARGVGWP